MRSFLHASVGLLNIKQHKSIVDYLIIYLLAPAHCMRTCAHMLIQSQTDVKGLESRKMTSALRKHMQTTEAKDWLSTLAVPICRDRQNSKQVLPVLTYEIAQHLGTLWQLESQPPSKAG